MGFRIVKKPPQHFSFTKCSTSTPKSGWRTIGGKRNYYRSGWEANYARFLEWQKSRDDILDWEHEHETFWFDGIRRGTNSYLPDFHVWLPGCNLEIHEVKGYMDAKSKTKIKRMAKYHPTVKLVVIDAKQYRKIASIFSKVVPGWE